MAAVEFEIGEYFIYQNGNSYELGRVKENRDDSFYFCYYSSGETAAATPVSSMHKIVNSYVINDTSLGGKYGREFITAHSH